MKIKQLLIAVCIGTMLAACSSKEDYTNEAERVPIRINASIEGNLVGTRAVENSANLHGTSFVNGENNIFVNIFYTGTSDVIPSYDLNGKYDACVYNDGSLDIGDNVFFPLDGSAVDVVSIYPGIVDYPNYVPNDDYFYVQKDQSTDEKYRLSDFMYASASGCIPGEPINLTYRHLLSKIIVKLNGYEGTASDYSVTIKQVQTGTNLDDNGTKLVSLAITQEEEKQRIADIKMGNYDDAGVTAIVIPQTISGGKKLFEVKIGSSTYQYTTDEEINFVSGHVYTFNLTFDGNAISTTSIDIEGWTGKDAADHKYNGNLE